jgi:hypothetical protein
LFYCLHWASATQYTGSIKTIIHNEKNETDISKKDIDRELKTDPRTGMPILIGSPDFTKEDIAKDFPDDSDRDSDIIRRSVGL